MGTERYFIYDESWNVKIEKKKMKKYVQEDKSRYCLHF